MLSLLPYFTVWQKDPSRDAFLSRPQVEQGGTILLERSYLSPLPFFYLGREASVIGLKYQADSLQPFFDIRFGPGYLLGYDGMSCEQVRAMGPKNIWIYGNAGVVRQHLAAQPQCFGDATLWIYQDGGWSEFSW